MIEAEAEDGSGEAFTVGAARDAAARDELAAWVARFLASPGSDNAGLAALLGDPPRSWLGPVLLPIDRLLRLAGPKGHPVLREVDDEEWRDLITGEPHTYHTTQPVACFVIGDGYYALRPRGILADVAPTVLDLLGLDQPEEMTGASMIDGYIKSMA